MDGEDTLIDFTIFPSDIDSKKDVSFTPLFPTNALWNETKLLHRIIYKSHNQHRPTKYFHLFCQLQRSLERLSRLEHWLNAKARKVKHRYGLMFLGYLNQTRSLIEQGRCDCKRVFEISRAHKDSESFLALMTAMEAISARIYMLLKELDSCIQTLYAECLRKAEQDVKKECKKHNLPQIKDLTHVKEGKVIIPSTSVPAKRKERVDLQVAVTKIVKKAKKATTVSKQEGKPQPPVKPSTTINEIDEIFKDFI